MKILRVGSGGVRGLLKLNVWTFVSVCVCIYIEVKGREVHAGQRFIDVLAGTSRVILHGS